jgi:hypothetical protein
VTIAGQHPTPISALFVQSLNELIDLHEKRITLVIHYRLPGAIWAMLYGLAILALAMGGYASGLGGNRRVFIAVQLSAALAFSAVLALMVALDRPRQHMSPAAQGAMIDLQEDMLRSIQSPPDKYND